MKLITLKKGKLYKIIKPYIIIGRTYCRHFPEEFTALTNQLIFSPIEDTIIRLDEDGKPISDKSIKTMFLTSLSMNLLFSNTTTLAVDDMLESLNCCDFFFLERKFRKSEYVFLLKNKKIISKKS